MNDTTQDSVFACPIDATPLEASGSATLRCAHGHSFDRAREGYVNLLVVQHKASRDPGDSKAMVAARRRFLAAGHYAPIARHVCRVVAGLAQRRPDEAPLAVLDAGCGEGYYLNAVANALTTTSPVTPKTRLTGIDISKWAIRAAAKRPGGCSWAVATNRHLPIAHGSIDLILSLFGFPVWDSFAAVQSAAGHVLLADAGPDHLIELRSVIYPVVERSDPPTLAAALHEGYRLESEHRVQARVSLTSAHEIADLLAMTPHAHRAPLAGRAALAKLERLDITADVVFRMLHRSST